MARTEAGRATPEPAADLLTNCTNYKKSEAPIAQPRGADSLTARLAVAGALRLQTCAEQRQRGSAVRRFLPAETTNVNVGWA